MCYFVFMKSIFFIPLIIFSFASLAEDYQDICLKIGYKNGSEKFNKCVSDLSSKSKTITNSSVKLAPKANASSIYMDMAAPAIGMAVGEVVNKVLPNKVPKSGSNITKNTTKKSLSYCQKFPLSNTCKVPLLNDNHKRNAAGGWQNN